MHASVLDRIDRSRAWDMFCAALESDITDVQGGTTPEGIHLGAMAGTVDIVLRHYAGIDTTSEVVITSYSIHYTKLYERQRQGA